MLDFFGLKHIWGRLVFRYAGRNICAVNAARSRKFYNLIGKLYDWLYADFIYGYRQAAQYLVDRFIQRGDSVLDIGCGTGLLMQTAQQKAGSLVGIDLSLGMLKQARNKLSNVEQAHLIAADCRALPLGGTFDKIVSSFMLVILSQDDQKRVVSALSSLLSERGALVFLSARDELSPEWLTKDSWREVCSQANLNRVEIIDLFDYYRIVIAERMPVEREEDKFPATKCVAPFSSQT